MTANAVSSVSLSPLLVLVCLRAGSRTLAAIVEAAQFGINILSEDQENLARTFAEPGADHFAALSTDAAMSHPPRLSGCVAWLECSVHSRVTAGDHDIVVGEVLSLEAFGGRPLVFYSGSYTGLRPA